MSKKIEYKFNVGDSVERILIDDYWSRFAFVEPPVGSVGIVEDTSFSPGAPSYAQKLYHVKIPGYTRPVALLEKELKSKR